MSSLLEALQLIHHNISYLEKSKEKIFVVLSFSMEKANAFLQDFMWQVLHNAHAGWDLLTDSQTILCFFNSFNF